MSNGGVAYRTLLLVNARIPAVAGKTGTAHAAKPLFLKTIIKDHPRSNEITDSEPLVPT